MKFESRPSATSIVALTALVVALAGTATALPGTNKVDRDDLRKGAVSTRALKTSAVRPRTIADAAVTGPKIADGAVNGAKIENGSIGTEDLAGVAPGATTLSGLRKVAATSGASFAEARNAATPQTLSSVGPFTLYSKCFTDTSVDVTFAYTYISTTESGSVFSGGADTRAGEPFLEPDTAEVAREVATQSADDADADGSRDRFDAAAPSGVLIQGQVTNYAKNGTLPGGDGIYGAGDVCLFGVSISG